MSGPEPGECWWPQPFGIGAGVLRSCMKPLGCPELIEPAVRGATEVPGVDNVVGGAGVGASGISSSTLPTLDIPVLGAKVEVWSPDVSIAMKDEATLTEFAMRSATVGIFGSGSRSIGVARSIEGDALNSALRTFLLF